MTRTLLIVDDIKSNREILKNMLGKDYRIIEAEHGEEALAIMNAEYRHISAVLLDLGMPVMDGYAVLEYMQSCNLSQLPVIVTTGQTDSGSEEKALRLGAKDYITKPYKSAIIKQRIWNTINLRETAAAMNALQHDRLTGLLSRDAFFERVETMAAAHEPGYYIMACCDVDKFKVINDQYGTEKGDDVLRHIAEVFRTGFEANDGICSRLASDDFAAFYPRTFRDSDILEKMRTDAVIVEGLASPIALSIGRYTVTDTAMSPSAMYDRAMLAAESVKGRYDSNIGRYDESMRDHLIHEQEIVTEMASALKGGQFEVWYQPQYNHSTGALIGSEALVRWRHPEKGLIPPSSFVPVFEQNGFIYAMDKYVWEAACRYLRGELDAGRSPLPVSVNISRFDVFQSDFIDSVMGFVEKYSIPVELLRLEITESAFAESTKHIVTMVKQLIDRGFTLEIDDFGSGYSSLNTLKNVPAQVVKLDMRFLETGEDEDLQRGGNILESIVRMTKWLGMSVIAEGVETKWQADFLKSIGCNYVQGYLYAEPMPEDEYRRLCSGGAREEKLLALETVENLDNDSFWNPESMDTLIFNSFVGGACIYEYHGGKIELIRATDKYAQVIGSAGMTVDDALKLDWSEHLSESSLNRIVSDLNESIATHREVTGEYVFLDLPGCPHETYVRSTMRVIASAGDRYLVYCTNENITAQRKAERREHILSEQMKAVMDNVACGITAVTLENDTITYILANNLYYTLLGYTREQYDEEIGNVPFFVTLPDDRKLVENTVFEVISTGKNATIEYRAKRRDGEIIWLRSNISMALFEGIAHKVQLSTYTDITARKQAELELQNASVQLRTTMDDIPGGFARIKVGEGNTMAPEFISKGLCRLTGFDHSELMQIYGKDIATGVHSEDLPVFNAALKQMLERGKAHSARYRLLNSDGEYIWLSIFGRTSEDAHGQTYLNIYYTDATEQVNEEKRRNELLDNLPYGAALYELKDGKFSAIHLNKRYWELVERPATEYSGADFLGAVYSDDIGVISNEVSAAIRENRDISCDIRVRHGTSGYRPFHIAGRILPQDNGTYNIYASYTPITDEEMSVQEMLPIALSAMMNSQTDYSFVKDRNLRYICCSRKMAAVVGLSTDEMRGKTDLDIFSGELAEKFEAEDLQILQTGESINDSVNRLPTADGSDYYASTSKFPLRDSLGNIIGVYGIGHDITETRKMQSRLEMLTNSIPGGIAVYEGSPDALDKIRLTYFSDGFCRLFGYMREEYEALAKKNPLGLVFAEDVKGLYEKVLSLVHDGGSMDYIYRAKTKSGDLKWINVRAVMGEPSSANLTVNAVFFDVTEHQTTLEQLRISEEENRLAMRHTHNAVCRYDVATGIVRIPANMQAIYGLPERYENVPYGPVEQGKISPETADIYIKFYEDINKGSTNGSAIFQRDLGKGWAWLEAHYSTIFSDTGKPISAVVSFTDITEQREKDSAYRRWQQSFEGRPADSYSLFRCNVGQKTTFDIKEGSLLGIDFAPGDFDFDVRTEEYVSLFVFEDDRERFSNFLKSDTLLSGYYQGKRTVTLEYREKLQNGSLRWLRLTVDMVEHSHSSDIEAYMMFENIDKLKRLELATLEQAETDPLTGVMNRNAFAARANNILHTSNPGAQHALLMLDLDGFKQVNDAFGHGAGDQALIDVAEALRTAMRHDDLVGRLGGDEFLVFLSNIPGEVIASNKAKQICAITRKSFSAEVSISCSVGIATVPRDGTDFETLYKKADAALYHVKGRGKDDFAFFQEEMADEHLVLDIRRTEPAASHITPKKRRILIVDDNRIDQALMSEIFAGDYIVEKAKDGNTALMRLRHYGSAISVVLLDLIMPGMDGFEVLNKMSESPELRGIPVIVVSADESREAGLKAIRSGASDYVSKPIDPELIRIRVSSAISKAENERLRAKNSLLEYQSGEVTRYRTALERSGIFVIENDWVAGTFIYDPSTSEHIAGTYDDRSLWHILLSDLVADTATVRTMQETVLRVASDRRQSSEELLVQLKTPSKARHWFRVSVYKMVNAFGLAGKIYMTFIDMGEG